MKGVQLFVICAMLTRIDGRGLLCYNCFKARNPYLCHATTQCSLEKDKQMCGTRKYTERGYVKYELGCVPSIMCPETRNTDFLGPVGKRRRREAIDVIKCCDTDYCNVGQFQIDEGPTTTVEEMSTVSETTTVVEQTPACESPDIEHCNLWSNTLHIDICQNPEVANHLCRNFCGKCVLETTNKPIVMTTTQSITPEVSLIKETTNLNIHSLPVTRPKTNSPASKLCNDIDSNCPYLEREEHICERPEVALGIGCYLTCNYCRLQCQDLDGETKYCQKESKEVLCFDEKYVQRSRCYASCGRCDLYCKEHPELCGPFNTTTSSGVKECNDKDSLIYCKYINTSRVCMDEQLVGLFGCYSTCSRCDLGPDSNGTRASTRKSISGATTMPSLGPSMPSIGRPSTPPGGNGCRDKDTLHYCSIINPDVVCIDEEHIIKTGCFRKCSRCDLDPNFSPVPSKTDLSTVLKTPPAYQPTTPSTYKIKAPSTRSPTTPSGDEITTPTGNEIATGSSSLLCQDTDGELCSKVNRVILCQTDTFIRLFGCFKTCKRCDLVQKKSLAATVTTKVQKHPNDITTVDSKMNPETATTSNSFIAQSTNDIVTHDKTTATTPPDMTTLALTTEMTTKVTTESTTFEETTTSVLTTTPDPFAACKDTGEFYLLRNNGMIPEETKFTLTVSSQKVTWIVLFNPELELCDNITLNYTTKTIDVPNKFTTIRNKVEKKGLYVVTSNKTDMNAMYKDPMLMEGFRVIPKENLSMSYVIPSYQPTSGGKSFIGIVTTKPNTDITITLRLPTNEKITFNNTEYHNGDIIHLHMGERNTLELAGDTDFTGTEIDSTEPVGVQTGVDMAYIPAGSGLGGQLLEMVPSKNHLGKSFLVPPFFENKTFVLRLIAAEDNTTLNITSKNNPPMKALLHPGDHLDIEIAVPVKVESDKPILTTYYQVGTGLPEKPFMTIIKPLEQLGDTREFIVPNDGLRHHILITSKKDMYPFLQIDGKGLIFTNPHVFDTEKLNTPYVVATADIGPGHHTIGPAFHGVPVKPGVIIYADSDTNFAYGYPV